MGRTRQVAQKCFVVVQPNGHSFTLAVRVPPFIPGTPPQQWQRVTQDSLIGAAGLNAQAQIVVQQLSSRSAESNRSAGSSTDSYSSSSRQAVRFSDLFPGRMTETGAAPRHVRRHSLGNLDFASPSAVELAGAEVYEVELGDQTTSQQHPSEPQLTSDYAAPMAGRAGPPSSPSTHLQQSQQHRQGCSREAVSRAELHFSCLLGRYVPMLWAQRSALPASASLAYLDLAQPSCLTWLPTWHRDRAAQHAQHGPLHSQACLQRPQQLRSNEQADGWDPEQPELLDRSPAGRTVAGCHSAPAGPTTAQHDTSCAHLPISNLLWQFNSAEPQAHEPPTSTHPYADLECSGVRDTELPALPHRIGRLPPCCSAVHFFDAQEQPTPPLSQPPHSLGNSACCSLGISCAAGAATGVDGPDARDRLLQQLPVDDACSTTACVKGGLSVSTPQRARVPNLIFTGQDKDGPERKHTIEFTMQQMSPQRVDLHFKEAQDAGSACRAARLHDVHFTAQQAPTPRHHDLHFTDNNPQPAWRSHNVHFVPQDEAATAARSHDVHFTPQGKPMGCLRLHDVHFTPPAMRLGPSPISGHLRCACNLSQPPSTTDSWQDCKPQPDIGHILVPLAVSC